MPDPSDYDSRDAFISDCISQKVDEGVDQDEAVGACHGIWEDHVNTNRATCQCEDGQCQCGGSQPTQAHARPAVNVETDQVREETFEGRTYRVAPVVAAVGGNVMNGALVPAEEWQRSLPSWNGRPLPVNHPERHGMPISANSPEVLEKNNVGQFFNAQIDDEGRFKGELWIDVERAQERAPDVLNALEQGQLEVSTAYFAVDDPERGMVGNLPYHVVHRQLLPDHLALLPNEKGACSWEDGCGAPRTHDERDQEDHPSTFAQRTKRWLQRTFGQVRHVQNQGGDTRGLEQDLMQQLEDQLQVPVFVETVFFEEQQVVYEPIQDMDEPQRLFQRGYQRAGDGTITLEDDVQEVERVVSFQPVSNDSGGQPPAASHPEVASMADKETRIGELISNERSPFTEEDRETLQALSQEKIETLAEQHPKENAGDGGSEDDGDAAGQPAPAEPAPAAHADEELTEEQYIERAPPRIRDSLRTMQREHEQKRERLIENIVANEANAFSRDELSEMDTERLQKLEAFARSPSYEGRGAQGRDGSLETHQGEDYDAPSLTARVRGKQ